MSGPAVTVVESGGIPVVAVESGAPQMTVVDTGGIAVTVVETYGTPFILEGYSPGGASFPDPSFEDETGYSVAGDCSKITGALSFTADDLGFASIATTGALDTAALASIPDNTACLVTFTVANFAECEGLQVRLKDGTPVEIGATGNGSVGPLAVTSGSGTPAFQVDGGVATPNVLDLTAVEITAA